MLLCAHGLALQNRQNHGLLNFAATAFAHYPRASGKIANAPPAAPGQRVLPAFIRSYSADKEEKGDNGIIKIFLHMSLRA
ncbi:hypothetical protein J2W55_002438 [Mucilaginibacter pocheonensis]|uniref:Uncharacterized protein n=1 Tax=Mucilaginibacter pocheonensis TaxID=398050 RepID=A0ABU1TBH2_9SPHI|nr:hypothetical protein [Mucilaginibacter pocheonensis]